LAAGEDVGVQDVEVAVCSFLEVTQDWDSLDEVEVHYLQAEEWQMDHTRMGLCLTSRTKIILILTHTQESL
jgi:hypothetical protein